MSRVRDALGPALQFLVQERVTFCSVRENKKTTAQTVMVKVLDFIT